MDRNGFLPVNREEMEARGWEQPDFVYVIGDAYVDHPSFGPAIISRVLESRGYRVAILAQPDWKDDRVIREFGRPRLGFLVSGGNMDSMVNHYSVSKKRRKQRCLYTGRSHRQTAGLCCGGILQSDPSGYTKMFRSS